jgi:hypothetical protein
MVKNYAHKNWVALQKAFLQCWGLKTAQSTPITILPTITILQALQKKIVTGTLDIYENTHYCYLPNHNTHPMQEYYPM